MIGDLLIVNLAEQMLSQVVFSFKRPKMFYAFAYRYNKSAVVRVVKIEYDRFPDSIDLFGNVYKVTFASGAGRYIPDLNEYSLVTTDFPNFIPKDSIG